MKKCPSGIFYRYTEFLYFVDWGLHTQQKINKLKIKERMAHSMRYAVVASSSFSANCANLSSHVLIMSSGKSSSYSRP